MRASRRGQANAISSKQKESHQMKASPKTKRPRRLAALLASAAALLCLGASAPAASAAPKWDAYVYWGPTNFQPGERGGFLIEVGNVGDETAEGWPTVEIELPEGVEFDENFNYEGPSWACSASGTPQTVTCSNPFAAFFEFLWPKPNTYINVGAVPLYLAFTVDIAADAPNGLHAVTAALSGSGATEATTIEQQIRIGGPVAGFGIRE